MSLATRCTACGTVFRVVQDQLKVSEGWVRCGRCQEVFNAMEGLFTLEREAAPAPADAAAEITDMGRDDAEASPADIAAGEVDLLLPDVGTATHSPPGEHRPPADVAAASSDAAAPEPATTTDDEDEFADARFDSQWSDEAAAAPEGETPKVDAAADEQAPAAEPEPEPQPAEAGEPAFMRAADRAAAWQHPRVRIALAVASVVLAAVLVLQVALHFHDRLAAAWPGAAGPLAVLCEAAGCTLDPPEQIDSVRVESSGLTPIADGAGYQLSVVLGNRAGHEVATPSIDLGLTDANGRLIARRVIAPREFGPAAARLAAGAETPLQLRFASGGERVAGYTIYPFYP